VTKDIDRHNPLGFYHLAEDFFRAARYVSRGEGSTAIKLHFSFVAHHLHAHSIELALKAFLRAKGVPMNTLRYDLGHKLTKVWDECIRYKLKTSKPKRTAQLVAFVDQLLKVQALRYSRRSRRVIFACRRRPSIRRAVGRQRDPPKSGLWQTAMGPTPP